MKYAASTGGREFKIELEPADAVPAAGSHHVVVDGVAHDIDLASVDGGFHYSLLVGSRSYEVFVEHCGDACFVNVEGRRFRVRVEAQRERPGGPEAAPDVPAAGLAQVEVPSPMPGVVVAVLVEAGQEVRAGQGLVIVEAMKMENEIRAPRTGVVEAVHVTAGQRVSQDDVLVRIG
ncbi:MAG: biotin/lipoyl-binding protein [Anaerolineae bacterium]